jgi:hypothetical protein
VEATATVGRHDKGGRVLGGPGGWKWRVGRLFGPGPMNIDISE